MNSDCVQEFALRLHSLGHSNVQYVIVQNIRDALEIIGEMCLSRGIDIIGGSIQLAQSQAQAMRDIGSTVLITLHRNGNGQQQICQMSYFLFEDIKKNKEKYEKIKKLSLLFQLTKQKTGLKQLINGDKRVVLQSWNFCKCWKKFFFSICYGQQWPFQLQLPFILFAVVTSKWNSDKKDKRTRDVQMKVEKILTCLLVDLLKTLIQFRRL